MWSLCVLFLLNPPVLTSGLALFLHLGLLCHIFLLLLLLNLGLWGIVAVGCLSSFVVVAMVLLVAPGIF